MINRIPIHVLDIITTAQGGKRLLSNRVAAIDQDPDYVNYLVCPIDSYFTKDFLSKGIKFIPMSMSRGLGLFSTFRELFFFINLIKKIKPDIVHAHTSKAGAVARMACAIFNFGRRDKIYVTYQVHSFYFNTLKGIKRSIYLAVEIFLSHLSDSLLFQNMHELEQARKFGMGKRAELINIGNGIKLDEFPVRDAPLPGPIGENIPFRIICIARVESKKNHRMLIDVAMELLSKLEKEIGIEKAWKKFRIFCVGEIGETAIIDYAKEMGIADIVRFTGVRNREEVASILSEGDLSVLTSTAEGKPRALMESMNAGLPCVATDVCGSRDVIHNGETGFLIPLNDVTAFAEAIRRLMDDKELYRSFSIAAQDHARKNFDEKKVIEKLKKIYREQPSKN